MGAGRGSDARASASFDVHRVELADGRSLLAGGEVKTRTVIRQIHAGYFKFPGGQLLCRTLLRRAGINREFVKMRVAILLALEINFGSILQPSQDFVAGSADPGIVAIGEEHMGLGAGG